VITDEEADTLRAIADRIRSDAEDVSYGYFPGGDPRDFTPDEESIRPEEAARYKSDCEAWERGDHIDRGGPHLPLTVDGMTWHVTVAHYGLGTYTYRCPDTLRLAQDLDDWIDRARNAP
jgi:hypothetical protein